MALKGQLVNSLREKSGLEQHRPYLGMSQISQCPRKLYNEFLNGRRPPNDQQHWYCWTGYLHEAAIMSLLGIEPHHAEVAAKFDDRFRGHVDHAGDGKVLEVKSVTWDRFNRIRDDGRPLREHNEQVQCYLRHGGWKLAVLIYIARDVPHREFDGPPFWTFDVLPDPALADKLDEKARGILAAIDRREMPPCECGYCRY
jgi:hypothetical protein